MRKIFGSLMVLAALSGITACGSDAADKAATKTEDTAKAEDTSEDNTEDATDQAMTDLEEATDELADVSKELENLSFSDLAKQAGSDECAAVGVIALQMYSMFGGENLPDDLIADAEKNMPSEVADDAKLLGEWLKNIDFNDPASLEATEDPEMEAASGRLEKWMDSNCETVDLGN